MKEPRIQMNFRMTKRLKEKLKQQATEMKISMRKVIEHKIENTPVVDHRLKNEKFIAIYALCKDINYPNLA